MPPCPWLRFQHTLRWVVQLSVCWGVQTPQSVSQDKNLKQDSVKPSRCCRHGSTSTQGGCTAPTLGERSRCLRRSKAAAASTAAAEAAALLLSAVTHPACSLAAGSQCIVCAGTLCGAQVVCCAAAMLHLASCYTTFCCALLLWNCSKQPSSNRAQPSCRGTCCTAVYGTPSCWGSANCCAAVYDA